MGRACRWTVALLLAGSACGSAPAQIASAPPLVAAPAPAPDSCARLADQLIRYEQCLPAERQLMWRRYREWVTRSFEMTTRTQPTDAALTLDLAAACAAALTVTSQCQ